MDDAERPHSARRDELLELAYSYCLEHGLTDLSLRPLAAAIGSSPRVLLFLFGSKDGLVAALLGRARVAELAMLDEMHLEGRGCGNLAATVLVLWRWLAAPEHRPLLTLWLEAYARSLVEPAGPWAGFAVATVEDWLALLDAARGAGRHRTKAGAAEATLALSVLRGALVDLLASGDLRRTTAAVERAAACLGPSA